MISKIYERAGTRTATAGHERIANNRSEHHTSPSKLKLPKSKTVLWIAAAALVVLFELAYFFLITVAEVARVERGAAIDRAALPLPASELLKAAEDNLQPLEKVVSSGNVPAVEYQKSKSEANR